MLAKNLVRQIIKRGGTAEIRKRGGTTSSYCTGCGEYVTFRRVLSMVGPDYDAWLAEDGDICHPSEDGKHTGNFQWEVVGELNGHDVHMFLCNGGQPDKGGNSYYTTRAIANRGYFDPSSDYNSGNWTFCNRLSDLDWAV